MIINIIPKLNFTHWLTILHSTRRMSAAHFARRKKKKEKTKKKKQLKTVHKVVSLGGRGEKRMTHSLAQAGLYFFNYTGVRGYEVIGALKAGARDVRNLSSFDEMRVRLWCQKVPRCVTSGDCHLGAIHQRFMAKMTASGTCSNSFFFFFLIYIYI